MAAVLDLTPRQKNPPVVKGKHKLKPNGKVLERDPAAITGIVIHQTAVWYSVVAAQIKKAGGDRTLARNLRGLNVACHVIAWADGTSCHVNPLSWYVHHGNGYNPTSLGLEIEGAYRGLVRHPFKGKQKPLAPETLSGAKAALLYLVTEGRKLGMPLTNIYAHRQSSGMRQGDPGEEIWRELVLGFAVPELGLVAVPGESLPASNSTSGPGKPVPTSWDPDGIGKY